MNRGVSLIELIVGVAVTGIVGLSASRFFSESSQNQKSTILRTQTEQRMRAFLENKKKQIVSSRNSYQGGGIYFNLPFTNRNCSFLTQQNPTLANCGSSALKFSGLTIDRFRVASDTATYFTETLRTDCLPMAQALPPGSKINPSDLALIRECTGCSDTQLPVVRMTLSNSPGVNLRYTGSQEDPKLASGSADDTTLASSFCISHNALTNPADPNSFTQFNLRIRTLISEKKSSRLLELSAVVPTPLPPSGGVRVISSGN